MLFRSDRKSTRLNSSHTIISYAVFCLKKKKPNTSPSSHERPTALQHARMPTAAAREEAGRPGPEGRRWYWVRWVVLAVFFFLKVGAPPELSPLPHPAAFRP